MASSSTTTSSLSRYRPIVLTIVAGALAYSTYHLYTTLSPKPSRGLHRRGAVHRRRRTPPTEQAVLEHTTELEGDENREDGTGVLVAAEGLDVTGPSHVAEGLVAPNTDATEDLGDGAETVAGTEVAADYTEEPANGTAHPLPKKKREGQRLKQLLYYLAEEQCRQDAYIHRGVSCNSCDMKPIRGVRYRCSNCADFDLCSECEFADRHPKTHIFYKVKVPAPFFGNPRQIQPVAYPGKPERIDRNIRSLSHQLRKHFMTVTKYELHEIDALYDQFTCLADWEWEEDPNKIKMGISRCAFDKVFVPHTSISPPKPNLLYDRMFSFYDTNKDGLIGFEEFLTGIACVHSKGQKDDKLRKIFDGYDIDGDGFVSRRDFLRMFRAYYAIQKEITHDLLAVQEEEYSMTNQMAAIMSSQPLSAVFKEPISPPGPRNPPGLKYTDRFGERRSDLNPILENSEDVGDREEVIANASTYNNGFDAVWPDEGTPGTFANNDAVRERRRRRQFYTDEEEGLSMDDADSAGASGFHGVSDRTQPGLSQLETQSSPNSSQDDFIFGNSATAPTHGSSSSRPVIDHYRGYQFPEAERDIGSEILYQVTQQGLNELLDMIFKEKEDLAMEVAQTTKERKMWRKEIRALKKLLKPHSKPSENESLNSYPPDGESSSSESDSSSDDSSAPISVPAPTTVAEVEDQIQEKSLDKQFLEISPSVVDGPSSKPAAFRLHHLEQTTHGGPSTMSTLSSDADSIIHSINTPQTEDSVPEIPVGMSSYPPDPTMPQNRPNSDVNFGSLGTAPQPMPLTATLNCGRETNHTLASSGLAEPVPIASLPKENATNLRDAGSPGNAEPAKKQKPKNAPSRSRLAELVALDLAQKEIRRRGGPGKLSFEEFERLIVSEQGRGLAFVEGWFELGSF